MPYGRAGRAEHIPIKHRLLAVILLLLPVGGNAANAAENPARLLWGDTHLHTNLSVDAYLFRNHTADAGTAYRFARGEPVIHPYHRARVQLGTPLDFLAVTDHAEFLGVPYGLFTEKDSRLTGSRLGHYLNLLMEKGEVGHAARVMVWGMNLAGLEAGSGKPQPGVLKRWGWRLSELAGIERGIEDDLEWVASDPELMEELANRTVFRSYWEDLIEAAERYNSPGNFTTLIGWEYSPVRDGANLHRVILTSASAETAKKFLPFSSVDSINPEDLWHWLDETTAATGAEFIAIPHNSNLSKAQMFARVDFAGNPIDAEYARLRSRWEPVAEVTQIKGTSETHPLLSPEDEFADFEFFDQLLEMRPDARQTPTVTEGDYVRPALMTGLQLKQQVGVNPYHLGLIGSTDSHTALASAEEDNFMGKMALDSIPENKERGLGRMSGWDMSASGLAAVWARDNTREEILAAFKRREVYGTTGPRIAVRFFGGSAFEASDVAAEDIAEVGYRKGVPMGGTLRRDQTPPAFLVRVLKDPVGANLDRVQIVKGWLDGNGKTHERVYDIAWSDPENRRPGADGKLPRVGDTVDRQTARYRNSIGASELATVWRDPDFDAEEPAFYYVRVLQIPTPRNSLYDSIALGKPHPGDHPPVIQERAYTSPIWYEP